MSRRLEGGTTLSMTIVRRRLSSPLLISLLLICSLEAMHTRTSGLKLITSFPYFLSARYVSEAEVIFLSTSNRLLKLASSVRSRSLLPIRL